MAVMRTIDHVVGVGATVGTGSVDLVTYSPPNSVAGGLLLSIAAKSSAANPLVCRKLMLGSYRKSAAGVVQILASTDAQGYVDLALLTTGAAFVASGGNIIVRATGGLLGTNLEWGCDLFVSIT